MRRGATAVLKWFSLLYVVLIVIQVYLAGEGIFGLNVINHSDDCDKHGARLARRSASATRRRSIAHRALGFFLTRPGALLFLICALIAWLPSTRIRVDLDPGADPDLRADAAARNGDAGSGRSIP